MLPATALERACATGEIEVAYQPIVDLRTGTVVECEALLRWSAAPDNMTPSDVASLAEAAGLLDSLLDAVLDTALGDLTSLPARGDDAICVSVNVSAAQLDPAASNLVALVSDALDRHSHSGQHLVIEVTEHRPAPRECRAQQTVRDLHAMGVRVAVDDFGIGHSRPTRRLAFAFDRIKIDRSLVGAIGQPTSGETADHHRALDLTIDDAIDLATEAQCDLVAEGIEGPDAPDLMTRLLERGIWLAQGFWFSPAVPLDRLATFVEDGFGDCVPGQRWA